MTIHPNRSPLNIILAALRTQRIEAGTRRDGTATAKIEVVLAVLEAIYEPITDLASARAQRISSERDLARACRQFCLIHDRAARGEIDGTAYDAALTALRS